MEFKQETVDEVRKHRLDYMEKQIIDVKFNIAIYQRMNSPQDQTILAQEQEKLERFLFAYDTIKGMELV